MKDIINFYMSKCGMTAADLSDATGISKSSISRYLNGARTPDPDGEIVKAISNALFNALSASSANQGITFDEIYNAIKNAALKERHAFDHEVFRENLIKLVAELGINLSTLSDALYISISSLSRILNGKSNTRDPQGLITGISEFISNNWTDEIEKKLISLLEKEVTLSDEDLDDPLPCLIEWLNGDYQLQNTLQSMDLLRSIDDFDLETYLSAFDLSKVHKIPRTKHKIPVTKKVIGEKGLLQGILDFCRATVTSQSNENVFLYFDFPIERFYNNKAFMTDFMKMIGVMLLQGKQIEVIHNVDRPLDEMLFGIQGWIPLYMTGQVNSKCSRNSAGNLFKHVLLVSGSAMLSGYSMEGMTDESVFTFSKTAGHISEGRKMSEKLWEESDLFVKSYDSRNFNEFDAGLLDESHIIGDRKIFEPVLPLVTMPVKLLDSMLDRYGIDDKTKANVIDYANKLGTVYANLMKHSNIEEIVHMRDEKKLESTGVRLPLVGRFDLPEIFYTPEEYAAHLSATLEYAETNKRYSIRHSDNLPFKHTRIVACLGRSIIISQEIGSEMRLVCTHSSIVNSMYQLNKLI